MDCASKGTLKTIPTNPIPTESILKITAISHTKWGALRGSYALVYGGNKHFLMTQPVKDFAMFIACDVDPLFTTGYDLYVFFHYDKESRHGGVMLIEAGTDKIEVSIGYAERNQYTFSERKQIKGNPSGIMMRIAGRKYTVFFVQTFK